MLDPNESILRQRRYLRGCFLLVIIGSLPLYCIGFFLWANAPYAGSLNATLTPEATFTPLGLDASPTGTPTDILVITATQANPLLPTPPQFIPPVATRILSPTPFIPTPTFAPTLTFPPTNTPAPTVGPTNTPLPLPSLTFTPVPPTNTTVPPPTNTSVPPPTDVPLPTDPPPPTEAPPPDEG